MHDLSITLFGPPQISRGKQQITLQRRKDIALLVYLAVTAERFTRDTLAAIFWPDSDQSLARANVRKNISRLKNDLGADVILTKGDQVSLNPDISLWLDVRQFQSNLEQPRKHNHLLGNSGQPMCEACQSALEEAVRLYRGGFLEGFSLPDSRTFDEWQFFQSEGYRQGLSEALQRLVRQHIHLREYDSAADLCRRWLTMDMLHEPAHRQLMLVYALAGQHAAALRQFEECSRLLNEELGVEPEPETVELIEAIRSKSFKQLGPLARAGATAHESNEAVSTSPQETKTNHNLPGVITPFVGRVHELEKIKKLLEEESCRVVTLIGPGGSGKTRLAIQTGMALNNEGMYKDGIWFVQLALLTDQNSIVPALQKVLNISAAHHGQENPRQHLFNYLRNRLSLLILDNFEHLLGAESISLISELIDSTPHIKILVTSRERLNIKGEHLFPVEGLETPSDDTLLSAPGIDSEQNVFSAIQLFEHSAQRVMPSFEFTSDNIKTIAKICRHVQGMPLAIELAAAWIEILPLEGIHEEIKKDLDFLRSELHDVPDRQRSLRAVFDSSWEKLSKQTRFTIKALSVFRSNFSREAAQAITGMSAKTLLELTNKSWIQPQKNGRYQIHELLRQFAYETLVSEPVTFEQIMDGYCAYYARHLSTLLEALKGTEQSRFFDEIEIEFENIMTAWAWQVKKKRFESVVNGFLPALFFYSEIRGKSLEFMDLCDDLLKRLENSPQVPGRNKLEIILRTAQGAFWADGHPIRYEFFDGIYPFFHEGLHKAWTMAQDDIHIHELGFWGILLAYIYDHIIKPGAAIERLKEVIPYFRDENKIWELANAKLHLARLLLPLDGANGQNTNEETLQNLTEALELFERIGDKSNCGQTLRQMGNLKMKEQKLTEAIRLWKAARANLLSVDVNEWAAASSIRWQIGDAYLQLGNFDQAFECFQEISRINLDHGFVRQAVGALSKESFEKARYGDLEDAIKIRSQCLNFIRESGPEYQLAWNMWEMGELMRLAGKITEADDWFGKAREIFEKHQDNVGLAFYWRGVGDLALGSGDYESASQAFEKCEFLARNAQQNWAVAYALNGRARSELGLNDIKSAALYFADSLTLARKVHDPGIALAILAGISELHAQSGKGEKAVEIGTFTLSHFASWHETKSQATSLLAKMKRIVFPRAFAEAQNKAAALDLWKTLDEAIKAVQEMTS
jgi:predicted ATPase/DNA-binding SARP family transcriptional activator